MLTPPVETDIKINRGSSLASCFGLALLTCLCLSHSGSPGNMFYLVMPTEQGETTTDDPEDAPTPTAISFPQPPEEGASSRTEPEEGADDGQSEEAVQLGQDDETGQLQAGIQSHVIKNVDEIFLTIEGLMSKLRQLKVSLRSRGNETATRQFYRGFLIIAPSTNDLKGALSDWGSIRLSHIWRDIAPPTQQPRAQVVPFVTC